MSESRWMVQVEKDYEDKVTIRFGGRLQLALKPLLGWLSIPATMALTHYAWSLLH